MNRTRLIPLALAISLAALLLSGCTPPAAATTLAVVEHADTDVVGDVAPAGDSVGDVLGFANPVFDAANAGQIGTDNGYCIRTAVGAAWECAWTLMLADGQITAAGPFLDAGDSVLAITGGTGAYAQARGQMKLHARNDQGTEYDFVYEIVK